MNSSIVVFIVVQTNDVISVTGSSRIILSNNEFHYRGECYLQIYTHIENFFCLESCILHAR